MFFYISRRSRITRHGHGDNSELLCLTNAQNSPFLPGRITVPQVFVGIRFFEFSFSACHRIRGSLLGVGVQCAIVVARRALDMLLRWLSCRAVALWRLLAECHFVPPQTVGFVYFSLSLGQIKLSITVFKDPKMARAGSQLLKYSVVIGFRNAERELGQPLGKSFSMSYYSVCPAISVRVCLISYGIVDGGVLPSPMCMYPSPRQRSGEDLRSMGNAILILSSAFSS